ncbi:TRAP transporter substrate-binding protein [Hydrogenophaga sp. A37]|uniref:TRAP transporter substrate-binding protein n=1 Tax=Hydrogenophaga sp. A37 TaxID=1945864 RepID=UPI00098410C6|nr:TRAP transporter substrate-binding protein [Hydrogenophaga sp. A37]OOG84386.1 C4-dicarboxylate ABC transporter substrate-binding protein [Hydrogenophaga sp. A37]
MHTTKRLFLTAASAAAFLTCAGAPALAQTPVKWDMPTAYPVSSFQTENLQTFVNDVDKATGGKLKITLHPGASLYKANEIKRAVQTGQVQAGEFILSGHSNENPLFGADSLPFLADSYAEARKLAQVERPHLEKLLAAQGMKLLYTVPWPGQSLYSAKPVESLNDLKGTKMRAYNPATSRIAQLAGAQPTTIQLAELGQALATGAVQNFLTSSASGVENKLYESVKHFYRVNAWLPKNAVVVSQKAFDALDKPTQEAMSKAAMVAQDRGWRLSEAKDAEYQKELAAKGMKVADPSPALKQELKAIGDKLTGEWLVSAGADGQAIVDGFRKP